MHIRYILLLLIILSDTLLASNISDNISITDMFKPFEGDVSIKLIQNLFGGTHMVAALSSVPENILIKKIFSILNVGIISIAGILLSYTVFTGVIRTAQDGGMSQIGKLSPMTLFRIVTGFTIMSPIPNVGFSVVQAGILWAAVHGVGFADTIYANIFLDQSQNNFANSVSKDGKLNTEIRVRRQRQPLRKESIKYVNEVINTLYKDGVVDPKSKDVKIYSLLHNVEMLFTRANEDFTNSGILSLTQDESIAGNSLLGGNPQQLTENGAIDESKVSLRELYAATMCLATIKHANKKSSQDFKVRQGQECLVSQSGICFGFNSDPSYCGSFVIKHSKSKLFQDFFNLRLNEIYSLIDTKYMPNFTKYIFNPTDQAITENSDIFDGTSVNVLNTFVSSLVKARPVKTSAAISAKDKKDQGWVTAGFKQAEVMQKFSPIQTLAPVNEEKLDRFTGKISSLLQHIILPNYGQFGTEQSVCLPLLQGCGENLNIVPLYMKIFIYDYLRSITGIALYTDSLMRAQVLFGNRSYLPKPAECQGNYKGCYNALKQGDMIKSYGIFGIINDSTMTSLKFSAVNMLNSVMLFWKEIPQAILMKSGKLLTYYRSFITLIGVISGVAQSGLEFVPYAGAYLANGLDIATEAIVTLPQLAYQIDINNIFRFLPAMGFISIMVLISGFLLGIWVQILPVLIYSLAIIGWLFYLIEAVVAAPIIAVGITHPEGHDFLGQAQQSFMLLMMVFMRPVLILLGLMTSLVLFNSATYILNLGFLDLFDFLTPNEFTFHSTAIALTIMFVYTVVIAGVAQISFMSIFRVVERVTIWLGGQPDQSPLTQLVSRIKGDMIQKTQQAGMGAGGDMTDAGVKSKTGGKGEFDSSTMASKVMNAKSKGGSGAKTS